MRGGRADSEIHFIDVALAGTRKVWRSRKRDVSARYSAIQGGLMTAKAGGTTRRPLVLQTDWGRILFDDGQSTVDHTVLAQAASVF